jgi:class 3 adenylate cyclase
MADFPNRTLICSVLFIDIVEYSRKPVVEQLSLKDRFNELLTEALRDIATKDRVILDTGDGAAVTFIGDPEDALFVATRLQQSIADDAEADIAQLSVRIGINLGPVRLVRDINGQPNVIGDAINVSQRVMNFAQPGQVLVSHSYYEAVSRLSDESSNLFTYQGPRTDKHIRDHVVYALSLTAAAEQKRSNDRRKAIDRRRATRDVFTGRTMRARAAHFIENMRMTLRRGPYQRASLVIVAVVATAAVAYGAYNSKLFARSAATEQAANVLPAQTEAVPATPAPPSPAEATAAPGADARPAEPPVTTATLSPTPAAAGDAEQTASGKAPKKATVSETAVLDLAIAPWGTVFVDGKAHGASPPLRELRLKEGRHKIEVRNTSFPNHVVVVNAKAGERIKIKHKFN